MKANLLGKRLLLKKLDPEEKTAGGLIIPSNAKQQQQMATVISLGSEIVENSTCTQVKIGDTVLMDKYAGQEVSINGELFTIANDEDIIAIMEI